MHYLKGHALCRRPLLTSRDCHLGALVLPFLTVWEPFWQLGSTWGGHFGFSGAPREAILAPRDHPGGPWEQQDGHEVVNDMILVDFGMIWGLVYISLLGVRSIF